MNFCTKCSSYYQVAGTCNCFAPPKVTTFPAYPNTTPWIVPSVWPTNPYPPGLGTITCPTVTWESAGGGCGGTIEYGKTTTLPDGTSVTFTEGGKIQ